MIPVRLRLRNFMSYRDAVAPVDFDGFHLACLSGNNGHGKSALLDALTWCLWGKARARSEDELIHLGATEMEVEFEYDLSGNRYRVLRRRGLRKAGAGVRGVPGLEYQVQAESGFRALTGDSVAETERKIRDTLGLDYDTFVNSSYILQGRADSFTTKTPAERKRVLSELLNLGRYDQLEEKAREKAREADGDAAKVKAAIDGLLKEVARRPEYEAQEARYAAETARLDGEVAIKDADYRVAEAEVQQLLGKQEQLHQARTQLDDWERRIRTLNTDMARYQAAIERAQRIVARRDEIVAAVARRQTLDARNATLVQASMLFNELQAQAATHREAINAERQRLTLEGQGLRREYDLHQEQVGDLDGTERERERLSAVLAETAVAPAERDQVRQRLEAIGHELGLARQLRTTLKEDMQQLRERLDRLKDAGAECPICQTPLSEAHRQSTLAGYQQDGVRMKQDYRDSEKQSAAHEAEKRDLEARLAILDRTLQEREEQNRELARLDLQLDLARPAKVKMETVGRSLAAMRAQVQREDFAHEERSALQAVERELAALGYDRVEHQRVQAELEQVKHAMDERERLALAEKEIAFEQDRLDTANIESSSLTLKVSSHEVVVKSLDAEVGRLKGCQARAAELQLELSQLMAAAKKANEARARMQQMIDTCARQEDEIAAHRVELARHQQRGRDYRDLVQAFGKNGIQAMIIETAIPEIEDEANGLLERLTDNRMHVKFETQRSAKSGDNLIETLDIKISDELGTRDYALFSGGEAFRINLAIRIALSRLLCRRAGASLQTLIIDEGFGTQDATGRERLVDAINRISVDFAKIIVITHIDELKDLFPARIEVVKTGEGSQVVVN